MVTTFCVYFLYTFLHIFSIPFSKLIRFVDGLVGHIQAVISLGSHVLIYNIWLRIGLSLYLHHWPHLIAGLWDLYLKIRSHPYGVFSTLRKHPTTTEWQSWDSETGTLLIHLRYTETSDWKLHPMKNRMIATANTVLLPGICPYTSWYQVDFHYQIYNDLFYYSWVL